MSDAKTGKKTGESGSRRAKGRKEWKKPEFEDVSLKVMAQPYIRFT